MADELTKKYYRIGDVAELLNLPQSTLRFWETQFSELKPGRNKKGTRRYTPNDIDILRVIKFLVKDKGLTIEGAREHMRKNRHAVDKRHEIISRLQDVRRRIAELLEALDERNS